MTNESTFTNFHKELQTLNYAELNYLMSDIMLEIKKRSYNEGVVKAMTSGLPAEQSVTVHAGETIAPLTKSDQQIRDEIIEKAKRDVAELVGRMCDGKINSEGNLTFQSYRTEPKFVVNAEKDYCPS